MEWVDDLVILVLFWLVNVLLAALAYKLQVGYKPIPMPPLEFWIRSTLAGSSLAAMLFVAYLLYYLTAFAWDAPEAVVNSVCWVLLLAYLPAGVGFLTWVFDLEDFVEGASVFFIHSFPLLLLLVLTVFFEPVGQFINHYVRIRRTQPPIVASAVAVPKGVPSS